MARGAAAGRACVCVTAEARWASGRLDFVEALAAEFELDVHLIERAELALALGLVLRELEALAHQQRLVRRHLCAALHACGRLVAVGRPFDA